MRSSTLVVLSVVMGMPLVGVTPAVAADPACSGTYASDQMVLDVQALETAIIDSDADAALKSARALKINLPCAGQRLPLGFLERVYRGIAGGYYLGGQREVAEGWFKTAIELDPTYRYGIEDLPGDHPLRAAYAAMLRVDRADPTEVSGKILADGGTWYLDGRKLKAPKATAGQPHLLQRDLDGDVQTWLIDGNAFPGASVADAGAADAGGKRKRKRDKSKFAVDVHDMGTGAIEIQRTRPREQIPLIAAGSGLIVAGIGLGVGSYLSKENFNEIRDSETKLAKSQRTTNRLALGAAAAVAVGAGTLTYGFMVSDGGQTVGGALRGRW